MALQVNKWKHLLKGVMGHVNDVNDRLIAAEEAVEQLNGEEGGPSFATPSVLIDGYEGHYKFVVQYPGGAVSPTGLFARFPGYGLRDFESEDFAVGAILAETIVLTNVAYIYYDLALSNKGMVSLASVTADDLVLVGEDVTIYDFPNLETISLPNLSYVGRDFEVEACPSLTTLDIGSLAFVGEDFYLYNLPMTTYANTILLSVGGYANVENCDDLTTVTFSALERCSYVYISSNESLTQISLPNLKEVRESAYFHNNALSETTVDALLALFVSLDGTDGTTLWENRTISLDGGTNAPPSATGLTHKATLEGRGCTVNVNAGD